MPDDMTLVQQIKNRYGPVIDLNANPRVMVDVIRLIRTVYGAEPGTPDGGGGPTGPTSRQGMVSNEDILREVLKLSRAVRDMGGARAKSAKKATTRAKSGAKVAKRRPK